jgi:hypothetical protein
MIKKLKRSLMPQPGLLKVARQFKYDPMSSAEIGFSLTSGGFASERRPLPQLVREDEIHFAPVSGGEADLAPLLPFAKEFDLQFLVQALEVVVEGKVEHLLKPGGDNLVKKPKVKLSKANMSVHLKKFCEEGNILEVCPPQREAWRPPNMVDKSAVQLFLLLEAWCVLFPVPKKDGLDRSIFDSREGGYLCCDPGPVNLCSIEVVVKTLAKYNLFWSADLSHGFYPEYTVTLDRFSNVEPKVSPSRPKGPPVSPKGGHTHPGFSSALCGVYSCTMSVTIRILFWTSRV